MSYRNISLAQPVQDWTAGAGSTQTSTTTTIYASRQVNTTDTTQDRPIFPGSNRIVIAFGATDTFSGHSLANRMMSAVTFYGADAFSYNTLVGPSLAQTLNFSMSYAIPAQTTTYAFQSFTLPDTVAHVVAINFIVSAASTALVHHLVLHDCSNSAFFQATATATGNPYPNTQTFINAFGSVSTAQSLVGNGVCKAPIWAWAHGGDSLVTPASAGIRIGANHLKYLIAEVHYNNPQSTQGVTDTSVIQLVYTTTMRTHDVGMLTVGDPGTRFASIPANTASKAYEAVCSSACTSLTGAGQWPTSGVNVFNSFLHMHQFGTKMWNTQMRAGKVLGVRGKVEYWDFNNQIAAQSCYTVLPGDQINTHCIYSTANSAEVKFGLSSSDEMCMAFLMYFPKMSAMTQCGYFAFNGVKLDMCGRSGSPIIFSNSQEAQYFDGTSETTCFGGSAQCAPAVLDSYSMCTGNWTSGSKVDPVAPKTSGAVRTMSAIWGGAFVCALLAAASVF